MATPGETQDLILSTIDDLVTRFLWDDRKEDRQLPSGAIEAAVSDGVISIDDMTAKFREALSAGLED